ncbi:hypothetical protein JW865_00550 [Candidatus Bathyarchaeota archaeon]|nr:hypothetical protein [Candidatus Bathyarchaeota archaeon]
MFQEILSNISKVLLVLGTVFVISKMINKIQGNKVGSFHNKNFKTMYWLHVNGSKIGIILCFVHGFTIEPCQKYLYTGYFLGGIMLILLAIGAYLSIKMNSNPMGEEDDVKWRNLRLIKWVFTFLLFSAIAVHYLL